VAALEEERWLFAGAPDCDAVVPGSNRILLLPTPGKPCQSLGGLP
jgi:hypothetical protein